MDLPRSFRPNPLQVAPLAVFGVMFFALLGVSVAMPWLDPRTAGSPQGLWLMAFSVPLWGSMAGLSVWALCVLTASYEVDSAGLQRRGVTGVRRYEWSRLVGYEQSGSGREGYRLRFSDGSCLDLPFKYLKDGPELKLWVEQNVLPRIRTDGGSESPVVSRSAMVPMVIGLSVMLVLVFGGGGALAFNDPRPGSRVAAVLCLSLCVFVVPALVYVCTVRTTLLPDRLVRTSWFGRAEVRLGDVRVLRLRSSYHDGGGAEWLTLDTGTRKLTLGSQRDKDYARLRDTLIARCSQARLVDDRPRSDRTL